MRDPSDALTRDLMRKLRGDIAKACYHFTAMSDAIDVSPSIQWACLMEVLGQLTVALAQNAMTKESFIQTLDDVWNITKRHRATLGEDHNDC